MSGRPDMSLLMWHMHLASVLLVRLLSRSVGCCGPWTGCVVVVVGLRWQAGSGNLAGFLHCTYETSETGAANTRGVCIVDAALALLTRPLRSTRSPALHSFLVVPAAVLFLSA